MPSGRAISDPDDWKGSGEDGSGVVFEKRCDVRRFVAVGREEDEVVVQGKALS
jgi:hypothetical protein